VRSMYGPPPSSKENRFRREQSAKMYLASVAVAERDNPAIVRRGPHRWVGQADMALMLYTQQFRVQNRSGPKFFP
jgi:hypothetical protein